MTRMPPVTEQGTKVVVISVVFTLCSMVAVGLRILAAKIQRRRLRLHDHLSFAALVFTVGYGVNAIIGVYLGGSGQHVRQLIMDPHQGSKTIVAGLKNFFASAFVWAFATCFCKLSILSLYLELFTTRTFRHVVYIMMGSVAAFWLGQVLTILLLCHPIAFNWDKTLHGYCGSTIGEEISFAAFNMVIDGIIVFLPTPVIWKLQMPVRKKISICCMFGLGLVICAINAARIGVVAIANQTDYSYALVDVAMLSGLEIWFGVIAACVPTLKPIFTHHLGNAFESRSYGYEDRGYKRTHSPSDYGAGWELERPAQISRGDEWSGTHHRQLTEDELPLASGLTVPKEVGGSDKVANVEDHHDESRPGVNDVRVVTQISISSTKARQ